MKHIGAQAMFDLRCWWRNGEQLLLMVIIPVLALVFGRQYGTRIGISPSTLVDGTVTMACFATAFVGQSIMTAFDRRSNALVVIGIGPVGAAGYVMARGIATLITCMMQIFVLTGVAGLLGFDWQRMLTSGAWAILGIPAFVGLGLLIASTLRAEAVLAVVNAVFILTAAVGGIFNEVAWTPVGSVRLLQSGELFGLAMLGTWTFVAGITSIRAFRWTD